MGRNGLAQRSTSPHEQAEYQARGHTGQPQWAMGEAEDHGRRNHGGPADGGVGHGLEIRIHEPAHEIPAIGQFLGDGNGNHSSQGSKNKPRDPGRSG